MKKKRITLFHIMHRIRAKRLTNFYIGEEYTLYTHIFTFLTKV